MTERRSFYRKIGYLVAIAVLWIPISLLSQPAKLDADGKPSPGGLMAQERDTYRLAQSTLGEIDPTSETAKLATLGMRGVAVQLLWNSAKHYQMVEDWTSLTAVLEQIIRLQPNFYSVWDYQAHNLSYNISVEFDDYRDRFVWVMEGIEFLKKGVAYNQFDPRFLARLGWFHGNKIGRADENKQYRALFAKQQQEKGEKLTDNWLVSHEWYKRAQALVDSGKRLRVYIGSSLGASQTKPGERAPSPLLFHSDAAMSLINYADNLEEDGTFGDAAKTAWENAAAEWQAYSKRDLASSYGYSVHLEDLERFRGQIDDLKTKMEALLPGTQQKLIEEKRAKLSEAERTALDKKYSERDPEEGQLASNAEIKAKVTWEEVALRAPDDKRTQAREIAAEIADLEQKINTIDTYRDIVNYNYWNERCKVEPTEACLEARELMHRAGQAYRAADLAKAKELYETAFKKWDEVLKGSPILRTNSIMADDLVEEIKKYQKLLGQFTGEDLPKDFILQDLIDLNEGKQPSPAPEEKKPQENKANNSQKTTDEKSSNQKNDQKKPAEKQNSSSKKS